MAARDVPLEAFDALLTEDVGEGVRRLTLHRPVARNALSSSLLAALHEALETPTPIRGSAYS